MKDDYESRHYDCWEILGKFSDFGKDFYCSEIITAKLLRSKEHDSQRYKDKKIDSSSEYRVTL